MDLDGGVPCFPTKPYQLLACTELHQLDKHSMAKLFMNEVFRAFSSYFMSSHKIKIPCQNFFSMYRGMGWFALQDAGVLFYSWFFNWFEEKSREIKVLLLLFKKNLAVSVSWVWDVLLMQLMLSIIWINFTQSRVRFKSSLDTFPPNKKCNKQMWFKSYINQILVISPPLFIFMVSPKTISGAFASSRLLAAGMTWARVAGSHENWFFPYSEVGVEIGPLTYFLCI